MSAVSNYLTTQNVTLAGVFIYGSVAILAYFTIPLLAGRLFNKRFPRNRLLLAASILFFISIFLPSPLIHGKNTNFTTHTFGGGIYSGLVWLYIKRGMYLRLSWFAEILSLYFLVCGLGVANELFEFFVNGIGLLNIPGTDTWWDLFANTVGVSVFWLIYRLFMPRES